MVLTLKNLLTPLKSRSARPHVGVGSWLLGLAFVVVACGPPTAPPVATNNAEPAPRTGPKTLVMGFRGTLSPLVDYGRPTSSSTEPNERWLTYHANLTLFDVNGDPQPQLAAKVPSLQDGDWKLNADSTMTVTWKLKANLTWHDGTPLTAEDYAFSYQLLRDPKMAAANLGEVANMTSVQAVDPLTIVITYKAPSIWGNHNGQWGLPALPKHLLEDLYQKGDPLAMINSPLWGEKWVGAGPFKVTSIQEGVQLDAEAFDGYALGRPKIDRLVFRIIPSLEVLQTNVLAGTVDVVTPGASLKPEHIVELKRNWDGQAFTVPIHWRTLYLQWRDPTAPWATQDPRFRQAMLSSLPRAEWIDTFQYSQTQVADYFAAVGDPLLQAAKQKGIVTYPFDPTKAQRLFTEAGWTKETDGFLHNSAGQLMPTFRCCRVGGEGDDADVRESLTIDDALQKAGVRAEHPIPSAPAGLAAVDSRKFNAVSWEGRIAPGRFTEQLWLGTWISSQVANDESRWNGGNLGGYMNPAYDRLWDQMSRSLEVGPRADVRLQLMQMVSESLPAIPLWYEALGVTARKGVTGIKESPPAPPLLKMTTWNIHTWDVN